MDKNMSEKMFSITCCLFLVLGLSSCQKGGEIREDNYSLFSTLDPVLGYAHNENYQYKNEDKKLNVHFNDEAYIHLKNGFVKMEYNANQKPLKIAVLGSSSSDPYLFDGNWPLAFHKLLVDKKIPHIIYNGAVSGYNSSQLLFKLIRDVFWLDQQDLVIVYHGGNDFIENDDILNSHPTIHPYSKKVMEQVYISPAVDMNFWERLKISLMKKKSNLQLGVPTERYSQNFMQNINYMKLVSATHHATFVHVLEGYLTSPTQYATDNSLVTKNEIFDQKVASYLSELRKIMEPYNFSISIQEEIPKDKKIFYDSVHFNLEGNKVIAQAILKKLNGMKNITK